MADIFGNAYITIVAGSAASAHDGFLTTPLQRPIPPCPLTYKSWKESENCLDLGDCYVWLTRSPKLGPLQKRAWCFQECILSPRKIVYGSEQMVFECAWGTNREDGAAPSTRIFNMPNAQSIVMSSTPPTKAAVLRYWYSMVVQYTDREMTNPRDKFPAISSVASLAGNVLGCRYLAGIWECDIIRGLSWMTIQAYRKDLGQPLSRPVTAAKECPPRRKVTRSPSWSWASVDGSVFVHYSGLSEKIFCEPSNFRMWPSDQDSGAWGLKDCCTPSMDAGELRVKGVLKRVQVLDGREVVDVDKWREKIKGQNGRARWATNPYVVPIAAMERHACSESCDNYGETFQIVGFGWFDVSEEKRYGSLFCTRLVRLHGLMLEEAAPGKFRRLGSLVTYDDSQYWFDRQQPEDFILV